MIVQCVSNSARDLPDSALDPRRGYGRNTNFSITVGQEYVVYAMTVFLCQNWYYICDDDKLYYPVWYPSSCFRVMSGKIPAIWEYDYQAGPPPQAVFSFPEWAHDDRFYERLTDKEPDAVATFNRYKELLDAEATRHESV
jgi:hypothetical protein